MSNSIENILLVAATDCAAIVSRWNIALKEELIAMLLDWKTGQDAILNKLRSDMAELKEQNANIKATSNELQKSIKFM